MTLYRFLPRREGTSILRRDLLRSKYAIALAQSIYQFEKLSSHARLTDLSPADQIQYHDLAQHIITLLEAEK